jgi:hypothetical protein
MYPIQPVASYSEIVEAIRHLPLSSDRCRVFRGQRRDFDRKMLVSCARRPSADSFLKGLQTWLPAIDALQIAKRKGKAVQSAYASFTASGTSPAWPSGVTARIDRQLLHNSDVDRTAVQGAALMQHYGADSEFLDCSEALDAALWFSHHDFRSRDVETSAEDWYGRWFVLRHRFSWYERADNGTGYIYVFDARPFGSSLAHGDVVGLSLFDPDTRPSVQQASLLYGDATSPFKRDLANEVRVAFSFNVPLSGLPETVQRRTTADMFPRPTRDPVYSYLLSLPFYAKDPTADTHLERMINLPLYADEAADHANIDGIAPFIVDSRQIWPTWVYNHLLRCKAEEARHLAVDTSALSGAQTWVLGGCTNKLTVVDLSVFPELVQHCPANLFLEFSALEVAGTPPSLPRDFILAHKARGVEELALHRINGTADLRALWLRKAVVRGAEGYRFQAFYGWTTSSFRSGPVLFLEQFPAAGSPDGNAERFLLRYALSVCCSVQVGVLAMSPVGSGGTSSPYRELNHKLMMPA